MSKHPPESLSSGLVLLMATAIAATVANLYYNQPLLPDLQRDLGLEAGTLGLIPSATQFGYAAAILLISPLGDSHDRHRLIQWLSLTLIVGLLMFSMADQLPVLVFATFLIGLSANITQQLIPLGASLSQPHNRGRVISTLMTGLTLGILLSRTLSGFVADQWGWRSVYLMAAVIALLFAVLLYQYLPRSRPKTTLSYPQLLASMVHLFRQYPALRQASLTGALWFAAFNALWATLALHVTAPPFSYSVQQAGSFGLAATAGII
ncbi:MAG: MFS transporter, partial [Candidatus Competibacteraceae bacterium]|nr:MFS transporter [Candidatus Competibacteraceae bacterium]